MKGLTYTNGGVARSDLPLQLPERPLGDVGRVPNAADLAVHVGHVPADDSHISPDDGHISSDDGDLSVHFHRIPMPAGKRATERFTCGMHLAIRRLQPN